MWSVLLFTDSEWTYTSGSHWWGGWVGFLTLLAPTFICNVVTFILVTLSPRLNRSSSSLLIAYLSFEDGLFSLFCFIQCAPQPVPPAHLRRLQRVRGAGRVRPLLHAGSTGWTLCCIAYNSHQKISFKPGLTPRVKSSGLHVLHMDSQRSHSRPLLPTSSQTPASCPPPHTASCPSCRCRRGSSSTWPGVLLDRRLPLSPLLPHLPARSRQQGIRHGRLEVSHSHKQVSPAADRSQSPSGWLCWSCAILHLRPPHRHHLHRGVASSDKTLTPSLRSTVCGRCAHTDSVCNSRASTPSIYVWFEQLRRGPLCAELHILGTGRGCV